MNLLSVKLNELNELTLNNLFEDIACNISNEQILIYLHFYVVFGMFFCNHELLKFYLLYLSLGSLVLEHHKHTFFL